MESGQSTSSWANELFPRNQTKEQRNFVGELYYVRKDAMFSGIQAKVQKYGFSSKIKLQLLMM